MADISDQCADNTLIHQGRLISIHKEKVVFPNGDHTYFDIVKHPGGAAIAAINGNNELCLLKQWRHALQQFIWEIPAGCLEHNEPPLETAKRELEEEAGIIADDWTDLGIISSTPGFTNEILYLYLAKDLSEGTVNLDDAEQLEAHWLALSEVNEMVKRNEIIDAKTLSVLLKIQLLGIS